MPYEYRQNLYGLQPVQRKCFRSSDLNHLRTKWRQAKQLEMYTHWKLYKNGLLDREGKFNSYINKMAGPS